MKPTTARPFLLPGTDKGAHLAAIRTQIRDFKAANSLDKVIVLWSANTERFSDIVPGANPPLFPARCFIHVLSSAIGLGAGVNDSADSLLAAIARSEPEVSPSTVFAVASILEGCTYINGSPQNTFVPGVMDLAARHHVFIAGGEMAAGGARRCYAALC